MNPETFAVAASKAADLAGTGLVVFGSVASTLHDTLASMVPLIIGAAILIFRAGVEIQKYLHAMHKAARDETLAEARFKAEMAELREEMREQSERRHQAVVEIQGSLETATLDRAELLAQIETLSARIGLKKLCPLAVDGVPACEQETQADQEDATA
jgi:hypothetical protein